MKHKFDFVNSSLRKIRASNLYRKLQDSRVQGPYIILERKKLINLCSNDYLGLTTNQIIKKQLQSSSRLIAGNDFSFNVLEERLADHKSQESALIFPTGYMANLGAIATLAHRGDLILSDELNHASIIEACKLSGANVAVYKHNNTEDLQTKLKQKANRKFIVTEGIFSVDGDFACLDQISKIASETNTILILDDAHGDFVVGPDGIGSAKHFGVEKKIDVYVSSLSKALGAFGGYVASNKSIIDLTINTSKSFIYTSALPRFLVEFELRRFESDREKRRKKLWKNIQMLQKGLKSIGYQINSATQIIPIIIGSEKNALEFGRYLFESGVFAQPIRYPTVATGKARIRISVTAWLSKDHIDKSIDAFESAGKKFHIL